MNRLRLLLAAWICVLPITAHAHTLRPAYLELNESAAQRFDVTWKLPAELAGIVQIEPIFPESCRSTGGATRYLAESSWITRSELDCTPGGLAGHELRVNGPAGTATDVLVRIHWRDGSSLNILLQPSTPTALIEQTGSSGLADYLRLGIEHLLTGFDHVLFVIGLLFLGRDLWALLRIVTSFTLAHSITLALSALDVVRLSQPPVEAAIALSILYLALELTKGDTTSMLYRKPWLIAFTFGLLHGFGFAGALREIGLPHDAIVWALLLFNLGVEIGQLIVVLGGLAIAFLIRRLRLPLPAWAYSLPVWVIGSISSFWLIVRTIAII